ncbi:hypothetical protein [Candidatus Avelusimicrobium faecicola]|uniref:hypothetical protein n=1 Tax=Candidatus Avelusimicrobium faecicola TaxID=3416205 RepID=UPI0015A49A50
MNTRTFLSNFPTFVKRWQTYRKKLGGTPLGWTVTSDYCLDDPNKNDCITFTISPILGQIEAIAKFLDKKLPVEIKKMKQVPQETIDFIKKQKEFFSLVFLFPDKDKLFNIQYFKTDMSALAESSMIPDESRKRLKLFARSLERKGLHKKVLQNLYLVSFLYGKIVEFLTIKHYTEAIHWFPDRDSIMREGKGIIRELANVSCTNAIAGRTRYPEVHIGGENLATGEFVFDPFTRYPDIISGVFSSLPIFSNRELKEKHLELLQKAILDNPRIAWFVIYPDKMRCFDMVALKLLCQKHIL